jgi:hypothetical protein
MQEWTFEFSEVTVHVVIKEDKKTLEKVLINCRFVICQVKSWAVSEVNDM